MEGEGSMAAANNSLKNNRNLLYKRKEKKVLSGSYAKIKLKKFPELTSEELLKIKERIHRENKTIRQKQVVGFILFLLGFISFLYVLLK
ncbi:hypothetical protein KFZ70_01340 [Tamlana fucoidanivorans]|uniref:Uncharacterized protein n=1 Tax=Allotamlana fucoidanivorans TaxID=2583814 RepID=A0A5C4SL39_9FLAO|nr:hypothetical protein [Tamlana fucoidanivorans]TNJ44654.1 hypothetical protein FGF67_08405 [Tamlana fucoidanivorans]